MTLADIKAARIALGDPVNVVFDDNVNSTGGTLHRLIYSDGSYEWVSDSFVFRCMADNDELVNPHGDLFCARHRDMARFIAGER